MLEQDTSTGLKALLEDGWEAENVLLEHKDAPGVASAMPDGFQEKPCRLLGLCTCVEGDDADAHHLHQKLVRLCRPFFAAKKKSKSEAQAERQAGKKSAPKKSLARRFLEDGFLVLKLAPAQEENEASAEQADPVLPIGWGDVSIAKDARGVGVRPATQERSPLQPVFFHVGFCNYTTYKFSCLHLRHTHTVKTEDGRDLLVLSVPEEPDFLEAAHAFRKFLAFHKKYMATWHVIFSDSAPLSRWETVANKVEIFEDSILPELLVWKACAPTFLHGKSWNPKL